eukprot:172435_1
MADLIKWSVDKPLLRKQLRSLSKTKLIKACKYQKVSFHGSKQDMIERILNKCHKLKKNKTKSVHTLTTNDLMILICGYIREYETKHMQKKIMIPKEFRDIIYKYYYIKDSWNEDYIDKAAIKIIDDCVLCETRGVFTVFGNHSVEDGTINIWKLKIERISYDGNTGHPYIGIVKDDIDLMKKNIQSCDWWQKHNAGYLFGGGCCEIWWNSRNPGHKINQSFNKKGDVLEITLNLNKYVLSFSVNGANAVVLDNIPKQNYRLAVTFAQTQGTSIRIM